MTRPISTTFLAVLLPLVGLGLTLAKADPPSGAVSWEKAADGLEGGLSLTARTLPANRHVELNSRVEYKVLVRNASTRKLIVELNANLVPYLMPSDAGRLRAPLPDRFRALDVKRLGAIMGAYDVTLAPGEAVIVPGDRGLYLGDADRLSFPRVESVAVGKHWIVQPIAVHVLAGTELAQFDMVNDTPYSEKRIVTIVDRGGQTREMSVPLVGARSAARQLFARAQIDVETRK